MASRMMNFLASLDDVKRRPEMLELAKDTMAKVQLWDPADLVGVCISHVIKELDGSGVTVSAGLYGLLNRAIMKASLNQSHDMEDERAQLQSAAFTEALKQILPKPKEDLVRVHVNLGDALKKISLDGLCQRVRPRSEVVDHLATEIAKKRKKGITTPFIFVDMKNFLPPWCAEKSREEDQSDLIIFRRRN